MTHDAANCDLCSSGFVYENSRITDTRTNMCQYNYYGKEGWGCACEETPVVGTQTLVFTHTTADICGGYNDYTRQWRVCERHYQSSLPLVVETAVTERHVRPPVK